MPECGINAENVKDLHQWIQEYQECQSLLSLRPPFPEAASSSSFGIQGAHCDDIAGAKDAGAARIF
eukprot:12909998-Prorocentrum_lima.AAC.1